VTSERIRSPDNSINLVRTFCSTGANTGSCSVCLRMTMESLCSMLMIVSAADCRPTFHPTTCYSPGPCRWTNNVSPWSGMRRVSSTRVAQFE